MRLNDHQVETLIKALQVLVLDPRILAYLKAHDPRALTQARNALRQAGAPATEAAMRRQLEAPERVSDECPQCSRVGAGPLCKDHRPCDECGQVVGGPSEVSDQHAASCSLHPANVRGAQ